MSEIDLAPIRMREARLTVEADDYTVSINQVIFTPQVEYGWERGQSVFGDKPRLVAVRWTVALGFAQDLATPDSLSMYLLMHTGAEREIAFEVPGRRVTATALILPAQIGGVANQIPASVATLPIFGAPDTAEV